MCCPSDTADGLPVVNANATKISVPSASMNDAIQASGRTMRDSRISFSNSNARNDAAVPTNTIPRISQYASSDIPMTAYIVSSD